MKNNYLTVVACLFLSPLGINTSLAQSGPAFLDCIDTTSLCVGDEGVRLPANNKFFLGEEDPDATSCSVHVTQKRKVRSTCGSTLRYEVQLFLFDTSSAYILQPPTYINTDSAGEAEISFDSELSPEVLFRENGIPYTTGCNRYHRIEWTVADACGNKAICESKIDLFDCKSPTYTISNGIFIATLSIGGVVYLDIDTMVTNLKDDCSHSSNFLFSLSKDVYSPIIIHIDPCEIPAFGVELQWLIWIVDEGRDLNCNDSIEWDERQKVEGQFNIVFIDNMGVDCFEYYSLGGEIKTEDDQTVEKVTVTLTSPGHIFPTYITAEDGKYVFDNIFIPADYSITARRNDEHKNGVSTLDLVYIQNHLLGRKILTSPYDLIAADVNNSQSVSAIDLVELRKLILGKYTELPNNMSWRFVDANFQFADPEYPWWPLKESIDLFNVTGSLNNLDFVAIKVGDINNTVRPNLRNSIVRNSHEKIIWHIDQKDFEGNDYAYINFYLRKEMDLQGFQFTLSNPDLEFIEASSAIINLDESNYALFDDKITFSWFDESGITLSNDDIVFTVRARAKKDGSLKHNLSINSEITEAEMYSMTDEIFIPRLLISEENIAQKFVLEPNPWTESATIRFSLPEPGEASLEVFDLNGRLIYSQKGMYTKGENAMNIRADYFHQRGLLLYSITSETITYTNKMIVLE